MFDLNALAQAAMELKNTASSAWRTYFIDATCAGPSTVEMLAFIATILLATLVFDVVRISRFRILVKLLGVLHDNTRLADRIIGKKCHEVVTDSCGDGDPCRLEGDDSDTYRDESDTKQDDSGTDDASSSCECRRCFSETTALNDRTGHRNAAIIGSGSKVDNINESGSPDYSGISFDDTDDDAEGGKCDHDPSAFDVINSSASDDPLYKFPTPKLRMSKRLRAHKHGQRKGSATPSALHSSRQPARTPLISRRRSSKKTV